MESTLSLPHNDLWLSWGSCQWRDPTAVMKLGQGLSFTSLLTYSQVASAGGSSAKPYCLYHFLTSQATTTAV